MSYATPTEAAVDAAFVEQLIKRSADAEIVLQDSGQIRFRRALQAAIELYQEHSAQRSSAQLGGNVSGHPTTSQ